MKVVDVEELREAIESVYGRISDLGCYSGNEWLSTERIMEIVDDISYEDF